MSGTFSVRVEARFEAAHFLRSYHGEPEPLHGHSYKVEAELARDEGQLDSEFMAVDFVRAEEELVRLAKQFDYKCVNDVPPFDQTSPSAENIAEWFAAELATALAPVGGVVVEIVLWEGPLHSVRYRPR